LLPEPATLLQIKLRPIKEQHAVALEEKRKKKEKKQKKQTFGSPSIGAQYFRNQARSGTR
jgi:hypothetical protein